MNHSLSCIFNKVIVVIIGLLLVSCDRSDTEFSISYWDTTKATIQSPPGIVQSRVLLERLDVAITFDESDPIYLERNGDAWTAELPFNPEGPSELGVTWFSENVLLAKLNQQITMSPENTSTTLLASEYQYFDSDNDGVRNFDEVGANTDSFDEIDYPNHCCPVNFQNILS